MFLRGLGSSSSSSNSSSSSSSSSSRSSSSSSSVSNVDARVRVDSSALFVVTYEAASAARKAAHVETAVLQRLPARGSSCERWQ